MTTLPTTGGGGDDPSRREFNSEFWLRIADHIANLMLVVAVLVFVGWLVVRNANSWDVAAYCAAAAGQVKATTWYLRRRS